MTLAEQVLEESLFADWLSEAGDCDSLDIPTKEIEKEVRKVIRKALSAKQAEVLKKIKEQHEIIELDPTLTKMQKYHRNWALQHLENDMKRLLAKEEKKCLSE